MNKLVSVIIPIYNVENYLDKCISSVINQTYKNLEIFLVNDGSTDNSLDIINKYKTIDSRIYVINKKNGGLSDARNAAIEKANGEYITFIDSDDYVSNDYIEFLLKNAINNEAEISTCSYINFYDGQEIIEKNSEKYDVLVLNNVLALKNLLYQKQCTTSAWGKLYKTAFFKNIRYPKGKICEDLAVTYLLFSKANRIVITTAKKYYYLQRKNSIINSKFNFKRMDALVFASEQSDFVRKKFPELQVASINREFAEAIFILTQMSFSKEERNYKKTIWQIIKKCRKYVIFDDNSRFMYRFYAVISYFGINFLQIVIILKKFIRGCLK